MQKSHGQPQALLTVPPSATPVMFLSGPVSGLMTHTVSPSQVLPSGRLRQQQQELCCGHLPLRGQCRDCSSERTGFP